MKCKNCGSENIIILRNDFSSSPYTQSVKCQNCNCKYDILTNQLDVGEIMKNQREYISITKTKKLLIVEDGSIDIDACEQDLLDMGIRMLVYRQGAEPPRLYDLGE